MRCGRCGANNAGGDPYCTTCGAALHSAARPVPAAGDPGSVTGNPPQTGSVPELRTGPDAGLQKKGGARRKGFVCSNCGKPFGPAEPNCVNCGYPFSMARLPTAKRISPAKALAASLAVIVLLAAGGSGIYEAYRGSRYRQAKEAFAGEDYSAARDAFEKLGGYRDSAFLVQQCDSKIADSIEQYNQSAALYNLASSFFEQGDFEDAYYLFLSLSGFEDSDERAKACIQSYPADGLMETGEAFTEGGLPLTRSIGPEKPAFLTVYLADGSLWASYWASPGTDLSILLPAGRYRITEYTGTLWFGTKDKFGSDEKTARFVSPEGGHIIEITQETEKILYSII